MQPQGRGGAVEPEAEYGPPELAVDLSSVPRDSTQLVESPDTGRDLIVWTVCGKEPPLDLTTVCGSANVADLRKISSKQCDVEPAVCTLSTVAHAASDPDPLVALIRRQDSVCDVGKEARCDVECSLSTIAAGRCPPSRQSFTIHAFHARGSAVTLVADEQMLRVQAEIVPVLAAAQATMHVAVMSELISSVSDIADIAQSAPGTAKCSTFAADLHAILREHVDLAGACMPMRAGAESASAAGGGGSGRIVLFAEITDAHPLQKSTSSELLPGNLTAAGILELDASISVGADMGYTNTTNTTDLQNAAISCLQSLQSIELQGLWTEYAVQRAPGHPEVPAYTSSMHVTTGSVTSRAAVCPQVSAAELAADATVAVVEDSLMQQLMLDQLVCAFCLHALCCWTGLSLFLCK